MPTKKITDLQLRDEVADDLSIPSDDGIQSYRVTSSQIWTYLQSKAVQAAGDLLIAATSATLARLAIGSENKILKSVSGAPAWAWPYSKQASYNDTGNISADDHIVLLNATSGAFTRTLPTAASMEGKSYFLKKIDTSFNAVTIATTSSQTIDGSTTTTLNTQNEAIWIFSDGTNWQILQRRIPSVWIAWTPTGDWVTNTTYTGFWRRIGDSIDVDIKVAVTGAPTTAALVLRVVPTGLAIDTAKRTDNTAVQAAFNGIAAIRDSGTDQFEGILRYESTTEIRILRDDGDGSVSNVTQGTPMTFANGDFVHIVASGIPISGWKG